MLYPQDRTHRLKTDTASIPVLFHSPSVCVHGPSCLSTACVSDGPQMGTQAGSSAFWLRHVSEQPAGPRVTASHLPYSLIPLLHESRAHSACFSPNPATYCCFDSVQGTGDREKWKKNEDVCMLNKNLLSYLLLPCSCFTCCWNASNCLQCDWSRVLFKEALWSSPCWYGRAAHHSSSRTYAHRTYISHQHSQKLPPSSSSVLHEHKTTHVELTFVYLTTHIVKLMSDTRCQLCFYVIVRVMGGKSEDSNSVRVKHYHDGKCNCCWSDGEGRRCEGAMNKELEAKTSCVKQHRPTLLSLLLLWLLMSQNPHSDTFICWKSCIRFNEI